MNVVIPKEYPATVVAAATLTPKVVFLQLRPEKTAPFVPGQYASFLLGNNRRPLSYASLPGEALLDFVIDISPGGVCSQFAAHAKAGDAVRFLSPYGRFVMNKEDTRPLLFVATGTGIAPIRAQIKDLLAQGETRPITLLFGNYTERDIVFREEFEALAQKHSTFTFIPVLSNAEGAWSGETGWVTHVAPRRISDLPAWSAYVCGNPPMVKDMTALLLSAGTPKEHIHTEQFTPAS